MKKSIVLTLFLLFTVVIWAQDRKESANKIITLTDKTYEKEISKGLVLVDYWAVWCGPCRKMEPVLKQIAAETNVKVGKLNVDDYKNIASAKGVSTIPTMFIYKDGKEVERLVGVYTKEDLLKVLNIYK